MMGACSACNPIGDLHLLMLHSKRVLVVSSVGTVGTIGTVEIPPQSKHFTLGYVYPS